MQGAKEWIVSEQPDHRKQSSKTEVFRWGLGTPRDTLRPFQRSLQSQNYFYNNTRILFAISTLTLSCGVFQRLYDNASDSLMPTGYPTVQLSSDTDSQSWCRHCRLGAQSYKTAHFRHQPHMGAQVTHTSARLTTDWGVPTTFPVPV